MRLQLTALLFSFLFFQACNQADESSNKNFSREIGPPKEIRLLGDFEDMGTVIKWRSIKLDDDGFLYSAPYLANHILKIDSTNDSIDTSQSVGSITNYTGRKWIDGTVASNGKIYYNPHGVPEGYLVLDPRTSPPSLSSQGLGSPFQVRGGAEADNGLIYSPIWAGAAPIDSVVTINTKTNKIVGNKFIIDRSGPVYKARPNWESENKGSSGTYDRYWGATKALNGKIYGTPWGSDRILIIDPVKNEITQGADLLNGGREIPLGDFDHRSAFWAKYSGGTLAANGFIYCFPREANTILKIDPNDDSAIEIPLPEVLQKTTLQKSFSSVLGPNGVVYSVPWSAPYLFWIDPLTDKIGFMDFSEYQRLDGGGSSGTGYWTYGQSAGDSIYYSPGGAFSVLKITP